MSLPLALAMAVPLLSCSGPSDDIAGPEVRVMLVGDSVTQGSAGDLTWRYRLWDHLRDSGVDVDLVGPNDDVYDNVTYQLGSDAYLDPDFDRDHAARWGMAFTTQDHPIEDLVEEFHPSVVVEMLGFNDFVVRATPAAVLASARTFVTAARSADPEIAVVLGQLPQTWVPGVPEYNAGLVDVARSLTTDEAPVVVAEAVTDFVDGVDTWDPAHLAASGEVKMAASVADALARLGIGSTYPRPLPAVENGPRVPATLTVEPGDGQVTLTWKSAPGVTAEYVWLRDATVDGEWQQLPFPVSNGTFTSTGLANGHSYEFRVQPRKGVAVSEDVFSDVQEATPAP